MENYYKTTRKIIDAAIDSVKPDLLVKRKVRRKDERLRIGENKFNLNEYKRIYVIGAGKASAFMGLEFEKILGSELTGGIINVKYDHKLPCKKIEIRESGHPVLDQNGLNSTSGILDLLNDTDQNDLVICLLSGGGSALLEKLPEEIQLAELQKVFELLLASGANIEEINTVRKHLSLVKGGQLARAIAPATCVSVILSDVIGDPLESIASGPTAADPSSFADAWRIIEKYRMSDKLPKTVRNYLQEGLSGNNPETLKAGDPIFEKVHNIILGNNMEALISAGHHAESLGFNTLVLSSRIQGEARQVAKVLAGVVQEVIASNLPVPKPACIIMGGETTVTLLGNGKGGRNQELALAVLQSLKSEKGEYVIASCGTDGTDGPTDAAGGIVGQESWKKVRASGLNPEDYLARNDAYNCLKQIDGLIMTGPTGTNVMDLIVAVIP